MSVGLATGVTLALALALVLTSLLLLSAEPTNAEYAAVQHELVGISTAETTLRIDLLSARSGVLRDGDTIAADVVVLQGSLAALQGVARGEAAEPIARIAAALACQQKAAAEVARASTLIHTSLAEVSQLSGRLATTADAADLAARAGAATAALLQLSKDVTADTVSEALSRLDDVARQPAPAELAADTAAFLQHGRRLVELLPLADETVRRFPGFLTLPVRDEVRAVFSERRDERERRALQYRVALYGLAILFLGSLVELGRRLREGTIALRERADVERILTSVSNTFISCHPDEIRSRILATLTRYGKAAQSSRAYVVIDGEEADVLTWAAPGVVAVPNWPEAVVEIMPVLAAEPGDVFSTLDYGERPPPEVERMFARHGVDRWSCVKLVDQHEMFGLLVFERAASRPPWRTDIANLVRLAGATFSNALQRERNFQHWIAFQEKAQRAKRLETVGLFASGIAHNFNNLLGVMIGHAEVAAGLPQMPAASSPHLIRIGEAGERARALVKSILAYGRRDGGPRHRILVGALVRDTAALLQPSVGLPIKVQLDLPRGEVAVVGDVTQLQQVFVNLIRNAAEASEAGTPVRVSVATADLAKRRTVFHGSLEPGRYVRIRVADRGVGIPDSARAKLFTPFFTTRAAGTGLGLATAAEVVRDLGGAFDLDTAPGKGTSFDVWLPAEEHAADAIPLPGGSGETVMVVLSRPQDVARAEDLLAELGYEPVGFTGGVTALATLGDDPERFVAVLIGAELSDMSGLDLARAVRASGLRVPLLELWDGKEAGRSTAASIFDGMLRWPLAPADVAATVSSLLGP